MIMIIHGAMPCNSSQTSDRDRDPHIISYPSFTLQSRSGARRFFTRPGGWTNITMHYIALHWIALYCAKRERSAVRFSAGSMKDELCVRVVLN